jgi:hypothetical protein
MPTPRPKLDALAALLASAGVAVLALSQGAGLEAWHGVGTILVLAAYLYLAARIAVLAGRVLTRARPRV